jgi:hypothetical protein
MHDMQQAVHGPDRDTANTADTQRPNNPQSAYLVHILNHEHEYGPTKNKMANNILT